MHEKRMHAPDQCVFLTLTYSPENLPALGSLVKVDLQLFMKRLRFSKGTGLRFFACGEYGETFRRPHYHVILFGTCFPDMKFFKQAGENRLYVSAELDGIWKLGFCTIGGVDFDSCAYVSGYVTKKITGDKAADHYGGREPEFCVMSRRPGLGSGYYEKFGADAHRHDSVIVNGVEAPLPRFYDKRYEIIDFDDLERLKVERRRKARLKAEDNTHKRLLTKEEFLLKKRRFFGKKEF